MSRLRWWVIPGALIVLARVVTLDGPVPDGDSSIEDAVAAEERVIVQDASGSRAVLPLGGVAAQALVIDVPADLAGERVTLTLWRRLDGRREAKAWMDAQPRVRRDGTLRIAGVAPGHYDVKVVAGERSFARDDVAAPGTLSFAASAAPVR
jgi:hypothetical protein